ncbi:MAG: hypothetical protein PHY80_04755 [Rickettsiales bacterium]|nr:hypothetical protein [Rickettsiales bacterium]
MFNLKNKTISFKIFLILIVLSNLVTFSYFIIKNRRQTCLDPKKVYGFYHYQQKDLYDGNGSYLVSNYAPGGSGMYNPTETKYTYAVNGKIVDASYVLYTKDFAKRHGLKQDSKYIANLDEGLEVIEMFVKTNGIKNYCGMRVLVDSKLPIAKPEMDELDNHKRGYRAIRFPSTTKEERKYYAENVRSKEDEEFWRRTIWNLKTPTIFIGTEGFKGLKGGVPGAEFAFTLDKFSQNYYKDVDFYEFEIGCSETALRMLYDKPVIGFEKVKSNPKDKTGFIVFKVPPRLVKLMRPFVEELEQWNFNGLSREKNTIQKSRVVDIVNGEKRYKPIPVLKLINQEGIEENDR